MRVNIYCFTYNTDNTFYNIYVVTCQPMHLNGAHVHASDMVLIFRQGR